MVVRRHGSRPRIRTSHVVAGAALVLITTGGATAAGMITGKDIKNNTVSTKDVKNGSLRLKDFKKSERSKLVGPAGPAGATGASGAVGPAGASAFAPPPSGTVIRGGGVLNVQVNGSNIAIRNYSPVPFTAAAPLTDAAPANLHFGSTDFDDALFGDGQLDTSACAGTAAAPVPAAGKLCVYPLSVNNADTLYLYGGSSTGADVADRSGFYLYTESVGAGSMVVRFVWAYQAP